jgi:hypothetical protein
MRIGCALLLAFLNEPLARFSDKKRERKIDKSDMQEAWRD